MCYHVEVPNWSELEKLEAYAVRNDDWEEYYHHISGFTHHHLPVITSQNPKQIQPYAWGLIPAWAANRNKANEIRENTLNAKSETAFELVSFKNSIGKKRCLIAIKGFYEWMELNKAKYPYYIHMKDSKVFTLGGIYEDWVDKETGEVLHTCTILTTEANSLMAKIHNVKKRMPLIINEADREAWLLPDLSTEQIKDLIKPYDENKMEAYTISKLITSKTESSNQAKVKDKLEYPELALFE